MSEVSVVERVEILLVDDRPVNLLALEAVLSNPSYDLVKVGSGDEALRYLLDHNPAVILMDVQMPGLDGYQTAAIIKRNERTREIPIIFVTAISKDERYVHQGYDHGAVDYIYKPYDAHILRAKVAVFADIRRQRERMARLVAVQEAATLALAGPSDVKESIAKVLNSICSSLGWDLGTFWEFDRRIHQLRCQAEWHAPGELLSEFLAASFDKNYFPGMGLPGKTWATKKASWITDMSNESIFPRSHFADRAGLRTVVALPIQVRDEVLGVMEFFSRRRQEEDLPLLKVMTAIGGQVGQVLSRLRAFELVRAEEARKAAVLETALDCIVSMDHEGRITEFNPAAERIFGYKRSEVLGQRMADVIIPERYREDHRKGLARYLASGEGPVLGKRIEVSGMRSDGTEFPAELAITRVDTVEPPQFTGFLRDITERKRTERDTQFMAEASAVLSSSLDYQETLSSLANLAVGSIADGCVIDLLSGEGIVTHTIVTAHRELDGKKPLDDLCGTAVPWGGLEAGNSLLYPVVSEELLRDLWKAAEPCMVARGLHIASIMVVPLTARGKVLGTIAFISADPARRFSEKDLVLVEELAGRAAMSIDNAWLYLEAKNAISTRDEFFSIASHELKTPITSLRMQLEMTQRMIKPETGLVPPPDRLTKMISTSTRQVDRLTHLVEELLDVVKIRAGKLNLELSEVPLSSVVHEVLDGYSGVLSGVKCVLTSDIEPEVNGTWDRSRMEQIVVNLLGNVVKYAPGKPVHVELHRRDGMARLVVRDSGPGIALERQGKIFERFERAVSSRSISGLGLGLFIVRQIVEAHHGSIRVESQQGQGAAFIIEMPLLWNESLRTANVSLKEEAEGKVANSSGRFLN